MYIVILNIRPCSEGKLQISILFKIISSGEMTITSIYTQRKELRTCPLLPDILTM
jgi:hypothetical protein